MNSTESAIHRFHRDLTLSTMLKIALIGIALCAMVLGPMVGGVFDGSVVVVVIGVVWLLLSFRSMRGSRIVAASPSLIAAGQFEVAEQRIVEALHSFSLFRTTKLLSLHHLAMLRHAQQRWQDTTMLCRALLQQRLGPASGLGKSAHLILADSLLETGDLRGAYESLLRLYDQRLSLGEALNLLSVQTDYLARIGAWDQVFAQVQTKSRLAELMPTTHAAQVQALLGLAARRVGRNDWELYLQRRAELLVEPHNLIQRRGLLSELWNR